MLHRLAASATIVLLGMGAAITYGVLLDVPSARLSIEYFTVAHPMILPSTDPTVLAVEWGVLAAWWVGALLGLPLALIAQVGPQPVLGANAVVRPVLAVLLVSAGVALVVGLSGYVTAQEGFYSLDHRLASLIPGAGEPAFVAVWWAHGAGYLCAAIGGVALCALAWRQRRQMRRPSSSSRLEMALLTYFVGVGACGFVAVILLAWILGMLAAQGL